MKKRKKKAIVKEVFIYIVLLILILLVLAVSLYDYIPSNISVAEVKSYSSDSKTTSIKQEIAYTNGGDNSADSSASEQELVTSLKSYSIEASDLTVYGQKNLYNSGNSNPFDYATETTAPSPDGTNPDNSNNGTTNNSSNGNNTNSSTNTTNTTSGTTNNTTNSTTGTFFESSTSK